MQAVLKLMGQEFTLECAPHDQRRVEDLAAALDARLAGFGGDAEGVRRLALTALSLLDETQVVSAALARAHCEIERLSDMLVEARLEAAPPMLDDERGRVGALRNQQGAA